MEDHIWIQLTGEIQPTEGVEIATGKKVTGETWLNSECARINAKGGHTLIHHLGEKGSAIFVRVCVSSKFRGKTKESLSEVEHKITARMESGNADDSGTQIF